MCELLGMSARNPTDVIHSLALLRPRGGEIGPHADGWGVAFYEGRAARVFKEPIPASESRCLAFIAEHDYRSTIVIGYIQPIGETDSERGSATCWTGSPNTGVGGTRSTWPTFGTRSPVRSKRSPPSASSGRSGFTSSPPALRADVDHELTWITS